MSQVSDLNSPTNPLIAPPMDDNIALRRILATLNQNTVASIAGGESEGSPASTNPVLVAGKDTLGNVRTIAVGTDGKLQISLVASDIQIGAVEIKNGTTEDRVVVNPSGEMSVKEDQVRTLLGTTNTSLAAIQASEAAINTAIGAQADAVATSDTGTFSLISLFKRALETLTTISGRVLVSLGAGATDGTTQRVVVASDQTVPVSATSLPLPAGAATSALQGTGNTSLSSIDTKTPSLGQALMAASTPVTIASNQTTVPVSLSSVPLATGAATEAKQDTGNTSLASIDTKLTSQATAANQTAQATLTGAVNETAPATDTASSGLNGRLQRIAQRLTSLIGLFPTAIGQTTKAGSLSVTLASDQDNATATNQTTLNTRVGDLTETAPASDTASSGLNGRLQRIAQNLTSFYNASILTSAGQGQVTTNSTGSTYQALGSNTCKACMIQNYTAYDVEVQQGGAGSSVVIPSDTALTFTGITNTSTLGVRRVDQSNTQITLSFRYVN